MRDYNEELEFHLDCEDQEFYSTEVHIPYEAVYNQAHEQITDALFAIIQD